MNLVCKVNNVTNKLAILLVDMSFANRGGGAKKEQKGRELHRCSCMLERELVGAKIRLPD